MKKLIVGVLLALIFAGSAMAEPKDVVVIQTVPFTCRGPIDIDLLKVTIGSGGGDAINFNTGCSGRIGRIECDTSSEDCVKVQNASPNAAHDINVFGGYLRSHGWNSGAHQDCVQAMGGTRIHFFNVAIDCIGPGGGNFFVNKAGSGATTPTDITCTNCAMGPNHQNPAAHVRINNAKNSGITDTLVCRGNTRNPVFLGDPTNFSRGTIDRKSVV